LELSPLIALPTILLSKVVSFLSPKDLWPLEATCRAISASMVSVRVLIKKNSGDGLMSEKQVPTSVSNVVLETVEDPNLDVTIGVEAPSALPTTSTINQSTNIGEVSEINVEPIKRKSSRVQSQMITSSKRIERQNRRNSIEFCFLASIMGCSTTDDPIYQRLVDSYNNHVQVPSKIDMVADTSHEAILVPSKIKMPQSSLFQYHWNDSSLYSFIHTSVSKIRHPSCITYMFHYVAHVSIYAAQVFMTVSDTTSLLDMQSNILDCTYS
jgi:hypothetical protein